MPLTTSQERKEAVIPWANLRLPAFPRVAIRVLQLANNENVQLHELSDLISSDAAFASEVLTIANSAMFAPRFPANSILQAIAVLGANHLQGVCLTVGARAYLGKSMSYPAFRAIWRHNLACGLIAEQVASAGFMDKDIAYTSGVLHDIGRFGLAVIQPQDYARLLGTHNGTAETILQAERDLFGWDHCEVGRKLIVDWELPREFETIVAEHHFPRRSDGFWGMCELIKLSCKMADTAGFAAYPGCDVTPFPDLLKELPDRERSQFQTGVEALTSEIGCKIHSLEFA